MLKKVSEYICVIEVKSRIYNGKSVLFLRIALTATVLVLLFIGSHQIKNKFTAAQPLVNKVCTCM